MAGEDYDAARLECVSCRAVLIVEPGKVEAMQLHRLGMRCPFHEGGRNFKLEYMGSIPVGLDAPEAERWDAVEYDCDERDDDDDDDDQDDDDDREDR
jgi:hypothetical protein